MKNIMSTQQDETVQVTWNKHMKYNTRILAFVCNVTMSPKLILSHLALSLIFYYI